MILVTKEESIELRRLFPNISITRTMKQKSKRGRRYAPETKGILEYLEKTR